MSCCPTPLRLFYIFLAHTCQLKQETSDGNADLNNVETGNNSEHVPVAAVMPQQKRTVYRFNIKKDMIDLFLDPLIMVQDIEIIVIEARGVEEVGRGFGVLTDVFSLFWKEALYHWAWTIC